MDVAQGGAAPARNCQTGQTSGGLQPSERGADVVPLRRKCKICMLPPDVAGYGEAHEAIREVAREGGSVLAVHRDLEKRFFRFWPESRRFSYDSLINHVNAHLGLAAYPARVEVRREAARWAEDLEGVRAEHVGGVALLHDVASAAARQMAEGRIVLAGADVVRLFDLLHRVELEEAAAEGRRDLVAEYRKALELLADVVGKRGTERFRLEVRDELRRLEERGRPGAMLAREACRRWNGIPPAERELADELSVVS